MPRVASVFFWLGALVATSVLAAALPSAPPVAPKIPVRDNYFGTIVEDDYRWMEDRKAPQFVSWITGENAHARAVLAQIPGRDALLKRIAAHTGGGTAVTGVQFTHGRIFYLKRAPAENSYRLYVRVSLAGPERLLVDPTLRDAAAKHYAIDYFAPSQDGTEIAYGISEGGSENSVIHVLNIDTGRESPETIERCEDGSPSWRADGKSFFYTQQQKLPPGADETEKYLNGRVLLHVVGNDPSQDMPILGNGVKGSLTMTPASVPVIMAVPNSKYALAVISPGALPQFEAYIAPADQVTNANVAWKRVASIDDKVTGVAVHGNRLFLVTFKDAPRFRVVETDADAPDIGHAKTVVPAGERVVEDIQAASDALYIRDLVGGPHLLRRYDFATGKIAEVALPASGALRGPFTDPASADIIFGMTGWVLPPRWYVSASGKTTPLALAPPWSDDLSPYVAEEVKAPAADGTLIPLSIVHKRGLKLDRSNPLWLIGYGAYGISLSPSFAARFIPLLEDGGVLAVAHVRGGGEYGEEWHMAAHLATKPNTYRDLIACAAYLVKRGYTNPNLMAIQGGSAGGITVGMALAERPDLFRVVVSDVGDSNALRAEEETDGAANSLEYGSTKTKEGFRALASVDALSHVRDGVAYPAVLLTTGMNDPRVAPWQPGKMTARLQAATSSGRPVILRVDFDAGHGIGSTKSQQDQEMADKMAFFYWQIGKPGYQPRH